MKHRNEWSGLSLKHVRRSNLIAVTKHGREDILQEGQDVLVGFKQTPHGLQLHHLWIWALCNWRVAREQRTLTARVLVSRRFKSLSRTVAYFFHDERVEADLVDALVQTVGLVDLLELLMKHHLLWVRQLRAQYPVIEFLWEDQRRNSHAETLFHQSAGIQAVLSGVSSLLQYYVSYVFQIFSILFLLFIISHSSFCFTGWFLVYILSAVILTALLVLPSLYAPTKLFCFPRKDKKLF